MGLYNTLVKLMFLIKNFVNKIWNDTLKMSSSYSISQQQNTPITDETHRDYKEINLPEQDFRTINNDDFNIQNNTSESLERYNVNDDKEKTKVNNKCKIYENSTKYPLLTLEDALLDSTALSLKEFDKILDIYQKHNNISDTVDPISFDDLNLIINNAESNVLNVEEENKNVILDKLNLGDADILNGNLNNNTNSNADDNKEILVENKIEPEFIDISDITLYNSSNISKIDNDVDEPAILARATNTILSNSKIESKFEVNKPTTIIKVTDNVSIESCIDSKNNHAFNVIDKEKIINESIVINSKAITFNIDKNEINDNINTSYETLVPNENSQYRGILLERKDNGENYFKESPKNNLTVIEILSSDDEDFNNISKNIETIDKISTISNEDLKEKSIDQNDSDCSGYHSSDFEFIDEEEAKKFGYYSSNNFETNEQNLDDFIITDYFDTLFPKDEQNNDRDNHVIPEGDSFVNLFNNQNCIRLFDYHVESKSVTTGVSMNTNYESIGFDMRYRENRPELEAFRQDADDSARKIRLMYPQENNKTRRRRRYRN